MTPVDATFQLKTKEIETFFSVLELMEEPDLVFKFETRPKKRRKKVDGEWLKIMKASAFLILYNLVESSIRSALGALYETVKNEGLCYEDVRKEFLNLWIEQGYFRIDKYSASPRNYQKRAQELIVSVIERQVLEISERDLPISGNLDAQEIRNLCSKHGIPINVHRNAKGGSRLELVKDNRNELAHGTVSFAECGRQYTVGDLKEIKREVIIFTRGILANITKYINEKNYAA